jgi:hypothetical protein
MLTSPASAIFQRLADQRFGLALDERFGEPPSELTQHRPDLAQA